MPNLDPSNINSCQVCQREFPRAYMLWVNDYYGIPWKLCCQGCRPKAEKEIFGYRHDFLDVGEYLKPDDY